LDEWSGAANRVLENGSGVAIGDVDGDGRPDIFFCSLAGQVVSTKIRRLHFEEVTAKAELL